MRFHLYIALLAVSALGCRGDASSSKQDAVDTATSDLDTDGDGHPDSDDCAPDDPSVHPGAAEVCDGIDNDCDGSVDEESGFPYYADRDEDGFGDADSVLEACSVPEGYVDNADDCDDADASVHPGADEYCDGKDDDCDGAVDEDDAVDATDWHPDADADGYGDSATSIHQCDPPSGYVADASDCDDLDPLLVTTCSVFGDGSDGTETITGTFDLNHDAGAARSQASGVAWRVSGAITGTTIPLDATDGLAAGDTVLIAALQGSTGYVGTWELAEVEEVASDSIILASAPTGTYSPSTDLVVVQRVPEYQDLTVEGTLTTSAFNDASGPDGWSTGIVAVRVRGTLTVNGNVDASHLGYPGAGVNDGPEGPWGAETLGGSSGTDGSWAEGGAGGGSPSSVSGGDGAASCDNAGGTGGLGGGGGGGKTSWCAGGNPVKGGGGGGGAAAYDGVGNDTPDDWSRLFLGGGASAGAGGGDSGTPSAGGSGGSPAGGSPGDAGGGAILLWARDMHVAGTISAEGGDGGRGGDGTDTDDSASDDGAGGGGEGGQGGSGGTVFLVAVSLDVDPSTISVQGGAGGDGGSGGDGFGSAPGGGGGTGAAPGGSPSAGNAGSYSGDGGAAGGGGAGGEAGAAGVLLVRASTVNGYSADESGASEALDSASSDRLTSLDALTP